MKPDARAMQLGKQNVIFRSSDPVAELKLNSQLPAMGSRRRGERNRRSFAESLYTLPVRSTSYPNERTAIEFQRPTIPEDLPSQDHRHGFVRLHDFSPLPLTTPRPPRTIAPL